MRMTLPFLGLTLCLISTFGATEYPIEVFRPASVGQQFQFSGQAHSTQKSSFSAGRGVVQEQKGDLAIELETLVKVLEIDAKGRITKADYVVSRCHRGQGKDKTELFSPDTVVTAFVQGGRTQYTVNGKPVNTEAQTVLALLIDHSEDAGAALDLEMMASATPRKVGESWKINPEPLAAAFQKQKMVVGKDDLQGQTTLEQVVKVGDVECLELASKIYIKKIAPPLPPGTQIKQAFGALRQSAKFPLDKSIGILEESMDLTMDITGQSRPVPNAPPAIFKSSTTIKRTIKRSFPK